MADEAGADRIGGWTVKGVPQADRDEINRAAKRADVTVGEWLKSAARLAIQAERNGQPPSPQEVGPGHPEPYERASLVASVEVVERLAAVLPGLTTDARGGGKLAILARKAIEQHLRALMLEPESHPAGHPRLPPPEDRT